MIVYRVERPAQADDRRGCNGQTWIGPYSVPDMYQYMPVLDMQDSDVHPTPYSEGLTLLYGHHVSAFASLEQLYNWFYYAQDCLALHGFQIGIYECTNVQIGEKQCVCVFSTMQRVGSMSISYLEVSYVA